MWQLSNRGSEQIVWNPNGWIVSTMEESENRGQSNIWSDNKLSLLFNRSVVVWLCDPLCRKARLPCSSASPSLFILISIELNMSSNHLVLCHPLLLPLIFPNLNEVGCLMSWLLPSDGQSIGTSALVLPMNIQGWFPLGLTGLISFLSKGFSRVFSSTTVWKHPFFGTQPSLWSNSRIHTWLLEKP